MVELGAIINKLGYSIKEKSVSWLSEHLGVYNQLHDYNSNIASLLASDPAGIKAFVPSANYMIDCPADYNAVNAGVINFLDNSSIIFMLSGGTKSQTYNFLTETYGSTVALSSPLDIKHARNGYIGVGFEDSAKGNSIHKTASGYAWISGDSGIAYHSDSSFSSITQITETSVATRFYYIGSYLDGTNLYAYYLNRNTSVSLHKYGTIDKVLFNLSDNSHSNVSTTQLPYLFDYNIVGIYGNYLLLAHSYNNRLGYFLIDITGTDTYWYYLDMSLVNLYLHSGMYGLLSYGSYSFIYDMKLMDGNFYLIAKTIDRTMETINSPSSYAEKIIIQKWVTVV